MGGLVDALTPVAADECSLPTCPGTSQFHAYRMLTGGVLQPAFRWTLSGKAARKSLLQVWPDELPLIRDQRVCMTR